jgi:tRNA A-37 threonylcarbamoyl transferase component Bud32
MIGTSVGKYRIVGQVGQGATGIVYKAVDETLDREVAIKVLNPHFTHTDIIKRFRAEATTLAKLSHPEIATIHELLRIDTDLLMVMELVRGETLEMLLERLGPMSPDRAGYLLFRILSALNYAHRAGIVHRDIKPANVMLTELGGVKIMDFGIARVQGAEHLTIDGCTIGTPAYMPPEQVLGEEIDGRADLYAAGVMLYRLLTGTLPFNADTPLVMLQKQIAETPHPLHLHRQGLPDWCETVVQRALAKAPADRFQTAEEFGAAVGLAIGLTPTIDLANAFALRPDQIIATDPDAALVATVAISRTQAGLPARAAADAVAAEANAPRTTKSSFGKAIADLLPEHVVTVLLRTRRLARVREATGLLAVVAPLGVIAYVAVGASATDPPAAARSGLPPRARAASAIDAPAMAGAATRTTPATAPRSLVFEAKVLVGVGERQREKDARLSLAGGQVIVTPYSPPQAPVFSVRYEDVISIHYSRDQIWQPPKKIARVIRFGDVMDKLGIRVERHRIALHADEPRVVVLQVEEEQVSKILKALKERTGRGPEGVPGG